MGYRLSGSMLEVCTCDVVCPCWVGRDPDKGQCEGAIAYHFGEGTINGVDVSGLNLALIAHIPGNVLNGNWRALVMMDEQATEDQKQALLEVFTGKAGGPVADFAGLIGEVVDVRTVPIAFDVSEGEGQFRAGDAVEADIKPLVGATGRRTVLADTAFSSIPGSPAYCAESVRYQLNVPEHGWSLDISGKNAVQGDFLFEHA